VKRKVIAPIGDFAKGWHQDEQPADLLEELNKDCLALKKYINGALIAKKFLHTANVPVHFHHIYATDDDPRDTKPVMEYKAEARQLTFAPTGILRLIKEWE
jgi:hypothetical protein